MNDGETAYLTMYWIFESRHCAYGEDFPTTTTTTTNNDLWISIFNFTIMNNGIIYVWIDYGISYSVEVRGVHRLTSFHITINKRKKGEWYEDH